MRLFEIITEDGIDEKEKSALIVKALSEDPSVLTQLSVIYSGGTALHVAVQLNLIKVAKLLLKLSTNVGSNLFKLKDIPSKTELLKQKYTNSFLLVKKTLYYLGYNENIQQVKLNDAHAFLTDSLLKEKKKPIYLSAEQITQLITLNGGFTPTKFFDVKDHNGTTALHLATEKNLSRMVLLLCYNQVDVNITNNHGETALHIAVKNGFVLCVESLFSADEKKIDRNKLNNAGENVESLLRKLENPVAQDGIERILRTNIFNRKILHFATIRNLPDIISEHIKLGANINIKDDEGMTPLLYAAKCNYVHILLYLSRHPRIDLNTVDKNGDTALHISVKKQSPECVKTLVTSTPRTVDKDIQNKDKKTAKNLIEEIENAQLKDKLIQAYLSLPIINDQILETSAFIRSPLKPDINLHRELELRYPKLELSKLDALISEKGNTLVPRSNTFFYKEESRKVKIKEPEELKWISLQPPAEITFDMIYKDRIDIVRAYLEKDGNPNSKIKGTPLIHIAFSLSKLKLFVELLRNEASLKETNDDGKNLLDVIIQNQCEKNTRFLLDALDLLLIDIRRKNQIFKKKMNMLTKPLYEEIISKGIRKTCKAYEINKLTADMLKKIVSSDKESDCLLGIYHVCSGKRVQDNLILDMDELVYGVIGLLYYHTPSEIINALIKLNGNRFLNYQQKLISYIIVKEVLVFSPEFGDFSNEIDIYLGGIDPKIAFLLRELLSSIKKFHSHSLCANYKALRNLSSNFVHKMSDNDITHKIQDIIDKRDNHKLRELAKFLAFELNCITARFYQIFPPKLYRQEKVAEKHPLYFLDEIRAYIIDLTLRQKEPEQQARVISLFILTARECLYFPYGPDLNSIMAITGSLASPKIKTTLFNLIEPEILKIKNQIELYPNNFFLYRKLLAAYKTVFPSVGVLIRDRIHIMEGNNYIDSLAFLGKLYEPLILLKLHSDSFLIKNETNLPFVLVQYREAEASHLKEETHVSLPLIPDLSVCTVKMIREAILRFKENCSPLMVWDKNRSLVQEEAFKKIEEYLHLRVLSGEIILDDKNALLQNCLEVINSCNVAQKLFIEHMQVLVETHGIKEEEKSEYIEDIFESEESRFTEVKSGENKKAKL